MKRTATYLLALAFVVPAFAQMRDNRDPKLSCDGRENWNGDRVQHCEIFERTMPAGGQLNIDAGKNGGVSVRGWTQNNVLVRAKVQTWAPTEAEAKSLVSQIRLETAGGQIRSDAPSFDSGRGYSVSFEVFVPHNTNVGMQANNGGIHIEDVRGDIHFDTRNGGVHLQRVAGDVRGQTTNGGLHIELMGDRWDGGELNARTTNGGVKLVVPENYSARLEVSTVNGGMNVDIPLKVTGKLTRDLNVTLGNGGPLIRLATTNGGINISRKSGV
ncbi:MAG TPA: DUF4097 family beta strand repeat-containing protein [Bryobacteraceae bacterium]|jgi:DUF4097 and DUF4098 domain-containing protein YvlB|nr:DUF4097 family beta strand repeat-containing protein [Bryobacteraceae bacterium]